MTGRVVFGLGLIALGVVLLLGALDVLDAGEVIRSWWPLVLVAIGAVQALEQRRLGAGPAILIGLGILLLTATTDVIALDFAVIWPLLLIAVGVWLLARRRTASQAAAGPDARIDATVIFGDRNLGSSSRGFEQADVTTIFGDLDLDLRDATPAEQGAVVDLTVLFGDVDVYVPADWRVVMKASSLLGDITHRTGAAPPPEDGPVLTVRGLTLFGDVDIHQ